MTGKLTLQLYDKQHKLKKSLTKHNTITSLGKAAALAAGLSGLYDYCNLYGAGVQKGIDTGDYSSSSTDPDVYPPTKPATGVVTMKLTSVQSSDFADKSFVSLEDSEVLGYASSDTETSSDAKQGIRQTAYDSSSNALVGSPTREVARFAWTGIEGSLNTIGMFIPPLAIEHLVDSYDSSSESPGMTDNTNKFIVPGDAGVTGANIAIGASHDKLLDLSTLNLSDFAPDTAELPLNTKTGRCAFEFGDYIITFTPDRGIQTDLTATQHVSVYNTTNNVFYHQSLTGFDYARIAGFIISNNTLYAVVGAGTPDVYSVAVSDSALTLTSVTASTVLNSAWSTEISTGLKYAFCPVQIGEETYTYVFTAWIESSGSAIEFFDNYIIKDMVNQVPDENYKAPQVANTWQSSTYHAAGVFLNCIYNIDSDGLYIAPAGQFGNLFSYFDLGETWTIATTDTLQISYFYELEEQ